jgi:D-xylose transport system substrate-binding protein
MRRSVQIFMAAGTVGMFALAGCSSSSNSKGGGTSTAAATTAAATTAAATTAAEVTTEASSAADTSGPASSSGGGTTTFTDGKGAKVGIILPDTTSSPRWITADPTALKADCKLANLVCDIQNANGDATKMKTIANQMEADKVKVLMIVNLDPASGAAIEQQATKNGILTVDYDRYTVGGTAALYVSFDNTKVGTLQGNALTQCPQVKGQSAVKYVDIDGASTDNNALLFKQGYDAVLSKTPGWTRVADQDGNWDAPTAGRLFNTMLNANKDIKAVMVANDTMAGAVITDLKNQHLNGQVAVSGQDASAAGLQHILDGDQCFTIYKPTTAEAGPAINAIAQLVTGVAPTGTTTFVNGSTKVPALLATPTVITKANVAQPINDAYTPKNTVCTGTYVAKCTAAGVK